MGSLQNFHQLTEQHEPPEIDLVDDLSISCALHLCLLSNARFQHLQFGHDQFVFFSALGENYMQMYANVCKCMQGTWHPGRHLTFRRTTSVTQPVPWHNEWHVEVLSPARSQDPPPAQALVHGGPKHPMKVILIASGHNYHCTGIISISVTN